ncbi:MAG TPA: hypothetical protein VFC01_36160 [Mycobacterium sp.]|nr:hypothetical protein [Mycobacterium sp.]
MTEPVDVVGYTSGRSALSVTTSGSALSAAKAHPQRLWTRFATASDLALGVRGSILRSVVLSAVTSTPVGMRSKIEGAVDPLGYPHL